MTKLFSIMMKCRLDISMCVVDELKDVRADNWISVALHSLHRAIGMQTVPWRYGSRI